MTSFPITVQVVLRTATKTIQETSVHISASFDLMSAGKNIGNLNRS